MRISTRNNKKQLNSSGTVSSNSGPADAMKTFFDLKNAALAIEVAENQKLSDTKLTTK